MGANRLWGLGMGGGVVFRIPSLGVNPFHPEKPARLPAYSFPRKEPMNKFPFLLLLAVQASLASAATVIESAREIPLAYDVDVVVVGGTSRGVAAAEAAANAGATVFLAAPRPYLGEDICGTYRLWLEPGEEPKSDLALAMFSTFFGGDIPVPQGYPFSYSASLRADGKHADPKNTVLSDGYFRDAVKQSVQYNGSVGIVADLGKVRDVSEIMVYAFERKGDFVVESIEVGISGDGKKWSALGTIPNPGRGTTIADFKGLVFKHSVPSQRGRYLRFSVKQASEASRILLGEIVVNGEGSKQVAEKPPVETVRVTTPWKVKAALDDALLQAKVDFLYGSYASDILLDGDGQFAGIVMANRSGRQAVRARVLIDATDRGVAARLAGAEFTEFPAGKQTFSRIVLGGKPAEGAKDLGITYQVGNKAHPVYEHTLELSLRDATWASFARADQEARNRTWHTGQIGAAEMLYNVPPDSLLSRKDSAQGCLAALMPAKVDHVYVLGPCADVPRGEAEELMRPLAGMAKGREVGVAAAESAKNRPKPSDPGLRVAGDVAPSGAKVAEVGEMLDGVWGKMQLPGAPKVKSPPRSIPVIGRYDTVVVGGGTGGAPAGVGAARGGARTLVIEYLHGLGGVGTLGRISKYYHGNRVGFTTEVDKGVVGMAGGAKVDARGGWNIENKMEWLRKAIVEAGGEVWFQSLGVGSVVKDKRFTGVVVATPFGRGVVLANTVIDSTGNAVLPACAGLETQQITGQHISVQGTGLPPFTPGESYKNSDWTFTDDDDVLDMWRIHVVGRKKYRGAFDTGQLIDTRARRRIIGDIMVSPMDIINQRVYPDIITVSKSDFDNHGFSSHDLFMITPPDKTGLVGNVPYRALLPKGYDGILVTGLGMSAHGDAMPVMRMQPDVQNQGYAAGKASAMAAEEGVTVRNINLRELQEHLARIGIIPEKYIGAQDSYPFSAEEMEKAVEDLGKDYSGIAKVLVDPDRAASLLRKAWKEAKDEGARLRYAHVLGMLYDDTGYEALAKAVDAAEWDKGWNFRGMGQYGATTSHVDNLVIALGRTGRKEAVPVILRKLGQLTPESEFSHARAVSMALEYIRAPEAAAPLAKFLQLPGIGGHSYLEINDVIARTPNNINDNSTRNNSLRELVLARALYRCGDHGEAAEKVLRQYASDYRGHYAKHARSILAEQN